MIDKEPARKDMWQLEKREQTFVDLSWSTHVNFTSQSFDKIAEAGFYYTGEADCVRCFWCSPWGSNAGSRATSRGSNMRASLRARGGASLGLGGLSPPPHNKIEPSKK